jgi:ribosomal protein S27E
MKSPKLHTGTFHCPECCTEFDLFAEQNLKCEGCGELLMKGPLPADYENEDNDA